MNSVENQRKLCDAARTGNLPEVTRLVNAGVDVNKHVYGYNPSLICAVNGNQFEVVKRLLAVPGIDVNTKNPASNDALNEALASGYDNIASLLLDAPGIKPSEDSLFFACKAGLPDSIVERLLTFPSVDVNYVKDDDTPLTVSIRGGRRNYVKKLVTDPRIIINKKSGPISTIHFAAFYGSPEVVGMLCAPDFNVADSEALREQRNYLNSRRAVDKDFYINTVTNPLIGSLRERFGSLEGESPLTAAILGYVASKHDPSGSHRLPAHLEVLRLLLSLVHDIDVNNANLDGLTPLHIAIQYGDIDVVTMLLNHRGYVENDEGFLNIDVNKHVFFPAHGTRDPRARYDGMAPLHFAVGIFYNYGIVQRLLAMPDINVNKQIAASEGPLRGMTPLHYLFYNGIDVGHKIKNKIIKSLLSHPSIDLGVKYRGQTVSEFVESMGDDLEMLASNLGLNVTVLARRRAAPEPIKSLGQSAWARRRAAVSAWAKAKEEDQNGGGGGRRRTRRKRGGIQRTRRLLRNKYKRSM